MTAELLLKPRFMPGFSSHIRLKAWGRFKTSFSVSWGVAHHVSWLAHPCTYLQPEGLCSSMHQSPSQAAEPYGTGTAECMEESEEQQVTQGFSPGQLVTVQALH